MVEQENPTNGSEQRQPAVNEEGMRLKLRRVAIDTYHENVAYLQPYQ